MIKSYYLAYNSEFGPMVPINLSKRKGFRGISGYGKVMRKAFIQIPFSALELVIDVVFSILEQDVPSLLSNKGMIYNGLDISIQGRYIHVGPLRQPLILENYSLVYRWSAATISYALYTQGEWRRIHRGLEHPSVRATEILIRRASGSPLSTIKMKKFRKLLADCRTCQRF